MFGFLKRMRPVMYRKPSKRSIFKYWNGSSTVGIDPLLVEERLDTDPAWVANKHPALATTGDLTAFNICVAAYARAFGISVYDGSTGLTRAEIFELMSTFDLYMWSLKKSTSDLAIPAEPTDATSSNSSDPITSDTSDCTSTCKDSDCDDPQTCTRECSSACS